MFTPTKAHHSFSLAVSSPSDSELEVDERYIYYLIQYIIHLIICKPVDIIACM